MFLSARPRRRAGTAIEINQGFSLISPLVVPCSVDGEASHLRICPLAHSHAQQMGNASGDGDGLRAQKSAIGEGGYPLRLNPTQQTDAVQGAGGDGGGNVNNVMHWRK